MGLGFTARPAILKYQGGEVVASNMLLGQARMKESHSVGRSSVITNMFARLVHRLNTGKLRISRLCNLSRSLLGSLRPICNLVFLFG